MGNIILRVILLFAVIGLLRPTLGNQLIKPNSITCRWQRDLQVILCQRYHRGWFRPENTEFELRDANVEKYTATNGDDDYDAYRLFLNTDIGRIDVYDYDRDRNRADADAAQFQALLVRRSGNRFLFFTYADDRLKNLILFFCGAILLLFMTGSTEWRIRVRCPFINPRIKR
jgi:hypothetical protein